MSSSNSNCCPQKNVVDLSKRIKRGYTLTQRRDREAIQIVYIGGTVAMSSTSNLLQVVLREQSCCPAVNDRSTMAYNNQNNYTLSSGLNVHPVHVSRTDEEGQVTQDRFWAIVVQTGDPSCVHARVDIDVLQPKFRGLYYGVKTIDEMRRRKRRRTAATKKEEVKAAREEKEQWDELKQKWDDVERAVFPDGFSFRQFTSVMIAGLNQSVARANNGNKGPRC